MNLQEFEKLGISRDDEIDVVDLLNGEALTTKQIADKLTLNLPPGSEKISVSNARQKLVRAESKDRILRKKINGIWHWTCNDKESKEVN